MENNKKAYFNWSTGKDSALALYYLSEQQRIEVDLLLTTVNAHFNRVSMHGIHRDVLVAQTRSLGIALDILELPKTPSMSEYNSIMAAKVKHLRDDNYSCAVFGDIFLDDLKRYRENMLAPYGIRALFPLWKKKTSELIDDFLRLGFKAVIVCVDCSKLDPALLGCSLSHALIDSLPDNVDPCGENGEFHTFCFDGPIFNKPILFNVGKRVFRTYKTASDTQHHRQSTQFAFCDITLATTSKCP